LQLPVRTGRAIVLGHEFQLEVSAAFVQLLVQGATPTAAPSNRSALEAFRLADARGRIGRLGSSGTGDDSLLFGGGFERAIRAQTPSPQQPPPRAKPRPRRLPR
jgi:hypothetical protein